MTIPLTTHDGDTTAVTDDTLEDLADRLDGRLLGPDQDGFAEATLLWNGVITSKPALVVQAAGAGDVSTAVDFARRHGVALSVKGAVTTSPAPPSSTAGSPSTCPNRSCSPIRKAPSTSGRATMVRSATGTPGSCSG